MAAHSKIPNEEILLDNLGKIAYTLDKAYLAYLKDSYVPLLFHEHYNKDEEITFPSNIRALQIERWVYDKDEKIADCFKNVMSVFAGGESSLALVVHRTPTESQMYFVTKNVGKLRNEDSKNDIELLADTLRGNFPGSKLHILDARENGRNPVFHFGGCNSVAVLSNVPSEKSENYISQGIDKLLNGIVPKTEEDSYYVVILAEAIPQLGIRNMLNGYQEMATAITPFAGYQFQAGESATNTEGSMQSLSNSEGISDAVTKTHSVNLGINAGINSNRAQNTGTSFTKGANAGVHFGGKGVGANVGVNVAKTVIQGITTALGASLGISAGYGYSWGNTHTTSSTNTTTSGTNQSISIGKSENTTYTYKSYVVADLLEKLEATMGRINESQSTGLWKCASYVLAKDAKTSKNIANFLRSITQGDDSYIEPPFIQEWSGVNGQVTNYSEVLKYIQHFCHPVFVNGVDGTPVTPTANASTTELANLFAFPQHSVQGLPVVECARFGREPHSLIQLHSDLDIGCTYHMHTKEENCRVRLGKNELTKHTFITGSTGSGKSNTIYKLLGQLCPLGQKDVSFLVVEPSKGEYKDVFGGRGDVTVYGTNPFCAPNLLQINPFAFPEGVHVLEHIDRLVEVFNACWPMYAAMPAILKEAVEKIYEDCGWNLRTSKNPGVFPTFADLLEMLPKVVESSAYSADTSSDYKGALVTRVRSLTRGIHGQIFFKDVPASKLFDENVIIDISRVGSQETKALIMGILILKLQEHRMSAPEGSNQDLKHITVLEEAHHLLRHTSSEQSQESSNLQGKSVEMLANAIAEMRTYGEGFVIADQSPGLMDMSVIRNTNTKIIMRLPDEGDRLLVGKGAGLTASQVEELSRLEQGVAAISQSDWLEPVLCKIDRFEDTHSLKERFETNTFTWEDIESKRVQSFLNAALDIEPLNLSKEDVDGLRKWTGSLELSEVGRQFAERVLEGHALDGKEKLLLISYVVGSKLKTMVSREDAIATTKRILFSRYSIEGNSEIIRRTTELFLTYFPVNWVLNDTVEQVEKLRWEDGTR